MKNLNNTKQKEILNASTLGANAFTNGLKRMPYSDFNLVAMLEGKSFSNKNKKEATTIQLFDAWTKAWDKANLSN